MTHVPTPVAITAFAETLEQVLPEHPVCLSFKTLVPGFVIMAKDEDEHHLVVTRMPPSFFGFPVYLELPGTRPIVRLSYLQDTTTSHDTSCKAVKDGRRITSFLYELMRDHVTPGVIQKVFNNSPQRDCQFTNNDLARYAQKLAKDLAPGVCKCGHSRAEHGDLSGRCSAGTCNCQKYED